MSHPMRIIGSKPIQTASCNTTTATVLERTTPFSASKENSVKSVDVVSISRYQQTLGQSKIKHVDRTQSGKKKIVAGSETISDLMVPALLSMTFGSLIT